MKLSRKEAKAAGIEHLFPKKQGGRGSSIKGRSALAALFLKLAVEHGLPEPVHEYEFAKDIGRKWRFDWLFAGWLALEIQGGIYSGGGHVRGKHLEGEYEKLNHACLYGYSVLFCTPQQVEDGSIFPFIKRVLEGE